MTEDQQRLLDAVAAVGDRIAKANDMVRDARRARAAAIRAADDAKVPRELIAAAAGVQWPMSRQRWSQLRNW